LLYKIRAHSDINTDETFYSFIFLLFLQL